MGDLLSVILILAHTYCLLVASSRVTELLDVSDFPFRKRSYKHTYASFYFFRKPVRLLRAAPLAGLRQVRHGGALKKVSTAFVQFRRTFLVARMVSCGSRLVWTLACCLQSVRAHLRARSTLKGSLFNGPGSCGRHMQFLDDNKYMFANVSRIILQDPTPQKILSLSALPEEVGHTRM